MVSDVNDIIIINHIKTIGVVLYLGMVFKLNLYKFTNKTAINMQPITPN